MSKYDSHGHIRFTSYWKTLRILVFYTFQNIVWSIVLPYLPSNAKSEPINNIRIVKYLAHLFLHKLWNIFDKYVNNTCTRIDWKKKVLEFSKLICNGCFHNLNKHLCLVKFSLCTIKLTFRCYYDENRIKKLFF